MFLKGEKRKFLFAGLTNVFLTNCILQLLLFSSLFPVEFSTFFSQLFNGSFGYFVYGKMVFNVRILNKIFLVKYVALMLSSWLLNNIGIMNMNFSENLSALIMIPFLAAYSYLIQKYLVFKS